MAPTTWGNSASCGHDNAHFAKGYGDGFQRGWALGFARGREIGHPEAAAHIGSRAGDNAVEGGEGPGVRHTPHHDQDLCLLSDVPLCEDPRDDFSFREEDIFYDAKSQIAASESDPDEVDAGSSTATSTSKSNAPSAHSSPYSEDLLALSSNADEGIPAPSTRAHNPDNNVANLAVAAPQPTSFSAAVPEVSNLNLENATITAALIPGIFNNIINDNPASNTPVTAAFLSGVFNNVSGDNTTNGATTISAHIPGATTGAINGDSAIDAGNTASSTSMASAHIPRAINNVINGDNTINRDSTATNTIGACPLISGATNNTINAGNTINNDNTAPTNQATTTSIPEWWPWLQHPQPNPPFIPTNGQATTPPIPEWPWLQHPNPFTPPSNTTNGTITTLHNIPLPHTITPTPPSKHTPPSAHRTRPPYPTLSAPHHNIYALLAQGRTVVDSPWRVLIGPLGAAARVAWNSDGGKRYLRSKLVSVGGAVGGGYGGYGRGNARGNARGGRDGGGRGGRGWDEEEVHHQADGGLVFSELVRGEGEVWYVLATFDAQEKAGLAVETFAGYACGGSIMWAWIYREEE
ncbi:uncharacterized protein B0H64DRAFT_375804 [Chaetomium fimeti]|uniref:Uncharacterized protein n=1 Tax=Chaetomium fimeti TaxID=1854472 RepID=A0AAE0HEJ6_9PEZI|nr:hypothetical protein B0H64DRAFT_375804 [Chaetomium fimeti]